MGNFGQGNYAAAVKSYDQVLQSYPDGTKAAAAELKKGMALVELGQQEAGIAALRHVMQRYPKSNEAMQARDRLRKLGVATTGTEARRPANGHALGTEVSPRICARPRFG